MTMTYKRNSLAIPWKLWLHTQVILFSKQISPTSGRDVLPPCLFRCPLFPVQDTSSSWSVWSTRPMPRQVIAHSAWLSVFPSCLMLCPSNETELEQSFLLELKSIYHFESRKYKKSIFKILTGRRWLPLRLLSVWVPVLEASRHPLDDLCELCTRTFVAMTECCNTKQIVNTNLKQQI